MDVLKRTHLCCLATRLVVPMGWGLAPLVSPGSPWCLLAPPVSPAHPHPQCQPHSIPSCSSASDLKEHKENWYEEMNEDWTPPRLLRHPK